MDRTDRPQRSRWTLKAVEPTLECRPGGRLRFLVEAANWGPATQAVHLHVESAWPCHVTPARLELAPGHLALAAVRVEVPADAGVGHREGFLARLHGARRPAGCELEAVVVGDGLEALAPLPTPSPWTAPAARRGRW